MDTTSSGSTRIAVLIDCDNVSARHIGAVLEELASYGVPTVKRAYGDWTTTQLTSWKPELLRNAIQPVQQFSNTVGKNSTDSALIIDAMDLLWQSNVEAFAIVSSDSDFTRLATRLRESGKRVFGLGHRKTPESLRRAVDQFIFLEVLQEQDRQDSEQAAAAATSDAGGERAVSGTRSGDPADDAPTINLQSALTKAINATSGDDGWSTLSQVGQHLSRAHPDFDPRDFGHQKLSTLIDEQTYLDTRTEGSHRQLRLRQKRTAKQAATTPPVTKAAARKTAAPRTAAPKAAAAETVATAAPDQQPATQPPTTQLPAKKRTRRATTAATST
ncbi:MULTISPECIES: NYN domain-containing protein [unclassified Ornithinimicrobium]|uniref:NYN domain-containing protein n=1 Tax=unclassified Ornithinimicrobium TaxID=2615080 RepID=UPI0038527D70